MRGQGRFVISLHFVQQSFEKKASGIASFGEPATFLHLSDSLRRNVMTEEKLLINPNVTRL